MLMNFNWSKHNVISACGPQLESDEDHKNLLERFNIVKLIERESRRQPKAEITNLRARYIHNGR